MYSRSLLTQPTLILMQARLHTAVKPSDPKVQALLSNLAGLDLTKLMARRQEPLIVPHYKLMTLEELQEVSSKAVDDDFHKLQH